MPTLSPDTTEAVATAVIHQIVTICVVALTGMSLFSL